MYSTSSILFTHHADLIGNELPSAVPHDIVKEKYHDIVENSIHISLLALLAVRRHDDWNAHDTLTPHDFLISHIITSASLLAELVSRPQLSALVQNQTKSRMPANFITFIRQFELQHFQTHCSETQKTIHLEIDLFWTFFGRMNIIFNMWS